MTVTVCFILLSICCVCLGIAIASALRVWNNKIKSKKEG